MRALCGQQASCSVGLTPSSAPRTVPGAPEPLGCLSAWTDRSLDRHRLWNAKLGRLHVGPGFLAPWHQRSQLQIREAQGSLTEQKRRHF